MSAAAEPTQHHLHTLRVGTAGPRIAFLHGLFGQGRNWTQVAKTLAGPDGRGVRALLVDLPDHGRSPWTPTGEDFSFPRYADQVAAQLRAVGGDDRWTLVGHSLGGKVSMMVALAHPELVERLAVVDIAPKSYGNLHRFSGYIDGMRELPLDELADRADAERRFAAVEPDPAVRGFLLQNLRREREHWRWQANLDFIAADAARGSASRIAGFPEHAGDHPPYVGPVLWLVGSESGYVTQDDDACMRELFPRVRQVTVKGVGHWVHSEAPDVTVEALRGLLAKPAT